MPEIFLQDVVMKTTKSNRPRKWGVWFNNLTNAVDDEWRYYQATTAEEAMVQASQYVRQRGGIAIERALPVAEFRKRYGLPRWM